MAHAFVLEAHHYERAEKWDKSLHYKSMAGKVITVLSSSFTYAGCEQFALSVNANHEAVKMFEGVMEIIKREKITTQMRMSVLAAVGFRVTIKLIRRSPAVWRATRILATRTMPWVAIRSAFCTSNQVWFSTRCECFDISLLSA